MGNLENLYIYITWRCNLACKHCWVSAGENENAQREMDITRYSSLIKEACELGVNYIKVSGGEPLLRTDVLYEIVDNANAYNCKIDVETNATLVTEEIASYLKANHVGVNVSLDGDEKTHNNLRGKRTAYQDTLEGIRILTEYGINPLLIYSFYEFDEEQMVDMINKAEEISISEIKLNPIMGIGRAKELLNGCMESIFSISATKINEIKNKYCVHPINGVNIRMMLPMCYHGYSLALGEDMHNICTCPYGNLLSILPNGKVGLCGEAKSIADFCFGDLTCQSLTDIWKNSEKLKQIRDVYYNNDLDGVCGKCTLKGICKGSCRVAAYNYKSSIRSCNPLCDELYHLGKFQFILRRENEVHE